MDLVSVERRGKLALTQLAKLFLMIISDFLSAVNHDDDFNSSRAAQMQGRLQVLAGLYAVIGALWLFIDYRTLTDDLFLSIGFVRILMVVAFLVLAFSRTHRRSLWAVRLRLFLLNLIPTLFFVVCERILEQESSQIAHLVYSYYPFVIVVQLAVFALTITEVAVLVIAPFAGMLYLGVMSGTLLDLQTLGNLILAMLLPSLAMWAAVSQLRMLMYLYRQATRDPLTGLNNRRLLMDRLHEEAQRSNRHHQPLCLMMMDLDKFKRVNDTYGHHIGDKLLKRFAQLARDEVRSTDVIGRYGGEEFVVVLPNTPADRGLEVAERLRQRVAEEEIALSDGNTLKATVSIGFAQMAEGDDGRVVLERADGAMYKAKESGRNRVVSAS